MNSDYIAEMRAGPPVRSEDFDWNTSKCCGAPTRFETSWLQDDYVCTACGRLHLNWTQPSPNGW